jgi:hypothetical protein
MKRVLGSRKGSVKQVVMSAKKGRLDFWKIAGHGDETRYFVVQIHSAVGQMVSWTAFTVLELLSSR